MLGTFQQSCLRIEVPASATDLYDTLTRSTRFQHWQLSQRFSAGLPDRLQPGNQFSAWVGPVEIQHRVDRVDDHSLRLLLSGGIDGFHEWYWGDGWVQSRLEGISLLPLNLGQTFSLLRLKQFLQQQFPVLG